MDKIRVVIADDHAVVREGTRELLEREDDLEVAGEAGDGEEAVSVVKKLKPDVVIMDIAMPRLNGIEATKKIKTIYPSIAVLILTAYENDQYIFALLDAGAAGYLLKNVHGQELIAAIRAVYSGESVLSPAVARKVLNRFVPLSREAKERQSSILTDREMEVVELAAKGLINNDIAKELCLSARTVQAHLGNILNKLMVGSRTEAVLYCLKRGWLNLEDLP